MDISFRIKKIIFRIRNAWWIWDCERTNITRICSWFTESAGHNLEGVWDAVRVGNAAAFSSTSPCRWWLGAHDDSIEHHLAIVTSIQFLAAYLCIYVLFVIARGVLKKLDYFQSRFGQSEVQKCKYRLDKWDILCQPKDQGGLGIRNLNIKNIALPCKWLFKLTQMGLGNKCYTTNI